MTGTKSRRKSFSLTNVASTNLGQIPERCAADAVSAEDLRGGVGPRHGGLAVACGRRGGCGRLRAMKHAALPSFLAGAASAAAMRTA